MLYSFNITAFFSCYFMFLCVRPSCILLYIYTYTLDSARLPFSVLCRFSFPPLSFDMDRFTFFHTHTRVQTHANTHCLISTPLQCSYFKLYSLHYMQRCKFRKITSRLEGFCMQVMKYLHSFFKD